jgi:hypothetical protein
MVRIVLHSVVDCSCVAEVVHQFAWRVPEAIGWVRKISFYDNITIATQFILFG